MDVLKGLLMLPVRLLRGLGRVLAFVLRPLLGEFSWTAPRWMRIAAARPRTSAGIVVALVVLVIAGGWGWHWYQNLPQPQRMTFEVQSPRVTDYSRKGDSEPRVYPLVLRFSGSAAAIAKVDKPVSEGITVSPAVDGQWQWRGDDVLVFTPASDWPVGQQYAVDFDLETLFAPQVRMARDAFEFAITPFRASLGSGEFYQSPEDARVKQVIQQITFNYPVDAAELEKRIHLAIADEDGEPGEPVQFTVSYGKHKLKVWIRSQTLALPRDPGRLLITIDSGVQSARGGAGLPEALHNAVRIPGLDSLRVDDFKPIIADQDKNNPQQVLLVQFNGSVRAADVAERIHAWVLPQHKPGDTDYVGANRHYPWGVSEVSEAVLQRATPLPLTVSPTDRAWQPLQSFRFHAEPGQRLYVRIEQGLKSFGGYIMGEPLARVFTVPDYPQMLSFVGSGSLLSLSGSQRVSIVSRNMPGVKLVVGRVLPKQLQHLVSMNRGDYSHPQLRYGFSADHIVERYVARRAVPNDNPGQAVYLGFSLGDYLADGKQGVFWLQLSGYDPAKARRNRQQAARRCRQVKQLLADPATATGEGATIAACQHDATDEGAMYDAPTDSRLIVITDLGLLVKTAADGSHKVFVQSIHSGRPVAGATVSVVAVNGQTLMRQTTGADGMVGFPSFKGFDDDRRPVMYLVTKNGDMSFLPIGADDRQLNYSRFDVGGAVNADNPGELSGYLFSDRGLYRPGETFHVSVIVRAADWDRSVAGMPLEAYVRDPRGRTARKIPLTMDASGFTELSYTLAETAATGAWSVNLFITRNGEAAQRIGGTTVQVKEFRPDRMKVTARLSSQVADGWVKPDELKALVDAKNLFGTPATNRRVSASITLQPAYPAFDAWPGWHFYDSHRVDHGYQQDLQDRRTDANGHAEFPLGLDQYADATYRLHFLARVYEAGGGRNVAAAADALVSSNDWLVGYKSVDDLSYVKRNATREIRLIAINPQTESIALDGLTAQLVERKYVSVLTKQPSGVYKYESRLKKIPLESRDLAIPVGGRRITLATDKPGQFTLRILRADGAVVNRINYTVVGAGNVSRSLERNAELQLSLDQETYEPGDTIQVSIRAPYTGSGLITIERDQVYAHAWFHTDTTSSVQSITLPADFEGTGYVNVQFVRDPASDEVFMSPLSYGVVPFRTSLTERRVDLSVDVPKLVKPGDDATFVVHTEQPARVALFAVNEGILQVARYQLGDPLRYFFRKRRLGVSTSQILDLILPEFEQLMSLHSAPGGGAAASPLMRKLNPFHRERKQPVAYWSGIVEVGGSRAFTYPVPDDFNGQLRVMAVAVSADRIGTWQGRTTVRGDFVLSPNAPNMLAPGDEARISVGVANNLTDIGDRKVPVKVTLLTGNGLRVVGSDTQTVNLASMKEGKVVFRVKATDQLGSTRLSFTASHGSHEATLGTSLSVRPAVTYRVSIDTKRVAAGEQAEFDGLRPLYDAYARRNAVMSSSPVVLARGLTSYLINYPHYCTEQIISAAMPRLIVANWPAAQAFVPALQPIFGQQEISNSEALANFLAVLQTRQNAAGGFGTWTATPDSAPFVSTYAMTFLLEARSRGVRVPQDMIDAGNRYLQKLADNSSMSALSQLRNRAYAIYLLTRQGVVTTSAIASVQKRLQARYPEQWRKDLAAAWLAAAYKLLQQDDVAAELIAGPLELLEREDAQARDFAFARYYGPAVRDATVLYIVSRHFPRQAADLSARVMENIAWPLQHDRYNTLSAAMTLLALDAYAGAHADGLEQMAIAALDEAGQTTNIGQITGNLLQATGWPADAQKLRFTNDSEQPAWGVVTQSGYDRVAPDQAIKNGLEIVREYTDAEGKPIDTVTLGQEIKVHVRIRAIDRPRIDSVAVVDLLPGGFEPVLRAPPTADDADDNNTANGSQAQWTSPLGLGSSTWHARHADIRGDRVVIYGPVTKDVREFVYQIRATNAGTFQVPPAYASALYQPRLQAQAPGGDTLTVVLP